MFTLVGVVVELAVFFWWRKKGGLRAFIAWFCAISAGASILIAAVDFVNAL